MPSMRHGLGVEQNNNKLLSLLLSVGKVRAGSEARACRVRDSGFDSLPTLLEHLIRVLPL